jgi:hypothetical protein
VVEGCGIVSSSPLQAEKARSNPQAARLRRLEIYGFIVFD